jgi:integrase
MWTLAVRKAGYGEKDGSRLKLHIHSLRKYFRTRGNWNNPDIAEFLLGHQTNLGAVYNRLEQNKEEVVKQYSEAVKYLQVYSRTGYYAPSK